MHDHQNSVNRIKDKIKDQVNSKPNENVYPRNSEILNNYSVDENELNCDPSSPDFQNDIAPQPKRFWGCGGSCT